MNLQQTLLKTYFGVYSVLSPKFAAKKGFEIFQKVRKKDIRSRELGLFEKAKHFKVESLVGGIDCYELGKPENEMVLMVHGWDSNAGSLSLIADEMVALNKRVILFNLPGHAFSTSSKTNLLECRQAMTAVLNELQPNNFSIISHSFGSAVTAYTLSKMEFSVDKLLFLTNPNKVENIFSDFKKMIGLGNKAYDQLLKLTEEKLGEPISAVSVQENLKTIKFNELFLIHDKFDKVLPYQNSEEVKSEIPIAQIETFEKIGHYKMLWNEGVIKKCSEIIRNKN